MKEKFKLYEIPEKSKLYFDDIVIIFDHLDGMYSYCYQEDTETEIFHIKATALFEKYKDGYRYIGGK